MRQTSINLKKDQETADIPILILTERAQAEESFRVLGLEVFLLTFSLPKIYVVGNISTIVLSGKPLLAEQSSIIKPFMPEDIISKVNEYVQGLEAQEPDYEFKQQSFKKVLVCGPVKYVVQDMVRQLQEVGCKTQVAALSIEVLTKALEFDPDIILIDVAMGGYAGP